MSDALCGPSNALQNFQKHASVDRTLQQDRLISRQSPSQAFRSQNPSEGILDPEFAAFESNDLVGKPIPDLHHAAHFAPPAPHMPIAHHAEPANWANDFQNLHISGRSHQPHQLPGPSVAPMSAQGWQNEFLRQQPQQHTPVQQHQPYAPGFQSTFATNYGMHGSPMGAFTPAQENRTSQQTPAEAFDDSAFEAAFEQARADMVSQETEVTQVEAREEFKEAAEDLTTQAEPVETIRIGSDTIPQSNKDDTKSGINDADELARTAGQLLNSVSHDTSQKFQQSNFLALMRRIRDREVQVEGDEFRETAQPLHPGGKYYPEQQQQKNQEGMEKRSWQSISQADYVHFTSNEKRNDDPLFHGKTNSTITTIEETGTDAPSVISTSESILVDDNSLYIDWELGDW